MTVSGKKVFVHIGIGKTGSTSIQAMMANSSKTLSKEGVFYPTLGHIYFGHHELALLANQQNHILALKSRLKALENEFREKEESVLVISTEMLCFSPECVAKLYGEIFNCYEAKIVFYVRDQISLLPSVYLENLKNNDANGMAFDEFFQKSQSAFDFLLRIMNWEKFFGKENIITRVYDKQFQRDSCHDFLEAIGLSHLKIKFKKEHENISLSPIFSDVLVTLDQDNISSELRKEAINVFLKISAEHPSPSSIIMPPQLRAKIRNRYRKSNQNFSNDYLSEAQKTVFLRDASV
jgi:hypothetical protein